MYFIFYDTRFFCIISLSILLNPKESMYIFYHYHEFVKFITKTIIFLTSYLIFSFFFFNELLGQFKNLEFWGKSTQLKFDQINHAFDDWRLISMEENRLIGFGIEIKPSHHCKEQRYQCLCTTSCPREIFVPKKKKKKNLFLTSKTSFPTFFGCDLVNNSIEQCWKTDPISTCQDPFSLFLFVFFYFKFNSYAW